MKNYVIFSVWRTPLRKYLSFEYIYNLLQYPNTYLSQLHQFCDQISTQMFDNHLMLISPIMRKHVI